MDRAIIRSYCLDGDVVEVVFHYDHICGRHFGEYPDFEESPRHTSNGRPWITAMQEGCSHSINKYEKDGRCMDCGSCEFFWQERDGDLIGICSNENQRKYVKDTETGTVSEDRLNS